jgi:hypothetical protein
MLPECLAINTLRLERDWSWKALADVMAEADVRMSWRTVHYLLTQDATQPRARDRTRHKLQKFVRYAQDQGWLPRTAPDPDASHEGETHAAPILRSHDARRPHARPRRPARVRE